MREQSVDKHRRYRARHAEKIAAYKRAYRAAKRQEIAAYKRAHYAAHREEVRAYRNTRRERMAVLQKLNRAKVAPELKLVRGRALRAKYPDRVWARKLVNNMIRSGHLVRPNACEGCGKLCNPQAHHHRGYATQHALDVEFLCPPCHVDAEARLACV